MDEFLCSDVPSGKDGSLDVCDDAWRYPITLQLLKSITNNFSEHRVIGRGAFGVVYKGVLNGETVAVKKVSLVDGTSFSLGVYNGETVAVKKVSLVDGTSFQFHDFDQELQSLRKIAHQHVVRLVGYCSEIITDSSCGRGELYRIIKPNCECLHQFRKNTVHLYMKGSNIPLDENLEPRIYDLDVSTPFDQNHICVPEIDSQMDPNGIFGSGATLFEVMVMLATLAYTVRSAVVMWVTFPYTVQSAVGVAKGQIIKWNSSVWCLLVKMLLFRKEIKVPVSRRSLNRKTQYLKRNGTFRRCSFLFIPAEAPTKKKTVANGNGEGADNGSSEEVSFCQANHGLSASAEMPISQSERSSISRSDEPATADNSSVTPSRTLESIWYIASAAAHHMTGVLDLLTNYTPMSGELVVHTPNMGRMQVLGSGSVNTANITLQDVWYVPGLDVNLVSTNQLTKLGHTVSLGPYGCRINKDSEDGALMGSAHFTDDYLFEVDFLNAQPTN